MQKTQKKRGFTLIEIMVATTIMAVLVGLVLKITNDFLSGWTATSGKLTNSSQAKIAMDFLAQDLSAAVFRNNEDDWLETKEQKRTGPKGFEVTNTTLLNFFSPVTDRPTGSGDICAMCYDLKVQNLFKGDDTETFALYRTVMSPTQTFSSFLGNSSIASSWKKSGTYNPYGSEKPPLENLLTANVVNFLILIGYQNTSGTMVEPAEGKGVKTTRLFPEDGTPMYADIVLTVITDEGAKVLNAAIQGKRQLDSDGDGDTDLTDMINEFGTTYKKRIYFQNNQI